MILMGGTLSLLSMPHVPRRDDLPKCASSLSFRRSALWTFWRQSAPIAPVNRSIRDPFRRRSSNRSSPRRDSLPRSTISSRGVLSVVQDDERKRLLAQACVKGKPVAEAPLVIVAFSVEEDIPVTVGGYMSVYPLDVAVAVNNLQLAATAEGLGTNWIVDFHEDKVRSVLGVPEGIHPIAIVPIGYPSENGGPRAIATPDGRKSPDEIIA